MRMSETRRREELGEPIKTAPSFSMHLSEDVLTLVADYPKVVIDPGTHLCTFIFFKKHYSPKMTEKGAVIDQVNEEGFLEVKVPWETAFAMSTYMTLILEQIRKDHGLKEPRFGPTGFIPAEKEKDQ